MPGINKEKFEELVSQHAGRDPPPAVTIMGVYVLFESGETYQCSNLAEEIIGGTMNSNTPEVRMIEKTIIDKFEVSTVFTGMDLTLGLTTTPPILFETMVFGEDSGATDLYCARYSTLDSARKGHEEAVQWLTNLQKGSPWDLVSPDDNIRQIANYFHKKNKAADLDFILK